MNTMHPLLDDATVNIARHEMAHAWMASECGFTVERVEVDRDDRQARQHGCTTIVYPLGVDTFAETYERSPAQAASWVVRILAVIRIGAYVEVHGGMIGAEPRARDLEHIASWREAVLGHYGADGWVKLYASSFTTIRTWYGYPSVREVLGTLSLSLAGQRRMNRYAFLDALALAGFNNCPPPQFVPVMPAGRRQPVTPAPVTPTSPRRRVALQAVSREPVAQGEQSKPVRIGCNPDGTPRPFTREELDYAQGIMRRAARRRAGS
jgi:hypothetical protein